jgi:hypothetical protein
MFSEKVVTCKLRAVIDSPLKDTTPLGVRGSGLEPLKNHFRYV